MTRPYMISPIETLTVNDTLGAPFRIDSFPSPIRGLISDFEAPEYIAGPLASQYDLDSDQVYGVARFIMEAVLGKVSEASASSRLAELLNVDAIVSRKIITSLEESLLIPNEISFSTLLRGVQEPELTTNAKGVSGLHYATLNELIRDLEPLNTQERMRFLESAKPFNRILVLRALSELKLGTSGNGQSYTFRQLAEREASQFTPQDWLEIIRSEPDILSEPSMLIYLVATPLGASLSGKNPIEVKQLLTRIAVLPRPLQMILVDPKASISIDSLVARGSLPATHKTAILKIVSLLILRDITPNQTEQILVKLGLPEAAAMEIASILNSFLPIPPTAPVVSAPRPPILAPRTPSQSRNTIDLRSKPTA